MNYREKRSSSLLLVGVWVNRNWVLGNLIKEINVRLRSHTRPWWVFSVFAGKHSWEKFVSFRLPKSGSYFFSYPSIFEHYLTIKKSLFFEKSLVFYTHLDSELGSLRHQAEVLNNAYKIYFMCKHDADSLVSNGLSISKVRIVYFGLDTECVKIDFDRNLRPTVLLASKYGERKGLSILPSLVKSMPDWRFIVLGRGWETFIATNKLSQLENFEYYQFSKATRTKYMSQANVFLSLSNLEGGPVPLLESMFHGAWPVVTNTGFAPDLIQHGKNGMLLGLNPTTNEVKEAILKAKFLTGNPQDTVRELTWDRISRFVIQDHAEILNRLRS